MWNIYAGHQDFNAHFLCLHHSPSHPCTDTRMHAHPQREQMKHWSSVWLDVNRRNPVRVWFHSIHLYGIVRVSEWVWVCVSVSECVWVWVWVCVSEWVGEAFIHRGDLHIHKKLTGVCATDRQSVSREANHWDCQAHTREKMRGEMRRRERQMLSRGVLVCAKVIS
jgi:hypothetical protein